MAGGRERKFLDFIDLNAGEGVVFEQIAAQTNRGFMYGRINEWLMRLLYM